MCGSSHLRQGQQRSAYVHTVPQEQSATVICLLCLFFDNCPNGSTANFTVCTSYWLNLMSQIILFAVHVKQAQQM